MKHFIVLWHINDFMYTHGSSEYFVAHEEAAWNILIIIPSNVPQ